MAVMNNPTEKPHQVNPSIICPFNFQERHEWHMIFYKRNEGATNRTDE